jgi:hypothetical protein
LRKFANVGRKEAIEDKRPVDMKLNELKSMLFPN